MRFGSSWSDALITKYSASNRGEVSLSVIIPTYNCAEKITATLESIASQNYPYLEVIIVDASSTDRTVEIATSLYPYLSRVYSVTENHLFDMIDKGISIASGRYLTFLFPGTTYLSKESLLLMKDVCIQENFPDLLYAGGIQRETTRAPRQWGTPFEGSLLQKGRMPALIPACWMSHDLFQKIGKFNKDYLLRADFDFFCRISLEKAIRVHFFPRILVDYDAGHFSFSKLANNSAETHRILLRHFGFWTAFIWFLGLNHLNFMKWWLRDLKQKAIKS